jgi:hypothetical protein
MEQGTCVPRAEPVDALVVYSAQLIAKTLGGAISFKTSEDAGTTVTVSLPLPSGGPVVSND